MPEHPVPEGFHTVSPHLTVRNASDMIDFYKKAFGAEEIRRAVMPDDVRIMHAELRIGDSIFFLNDEFPEMGGVSPLGLKGSPVTIHLYVQDVDRLWEQAVNAGAKIVMPLDNQFWGDRYGIVEDPSGHKWSMASHIEDLSEEEKWEKMREEGG